VRDQWLHEFVRNRQVREDPLGKPAFLQQGADHLCALRNDTRMSDEGGIPGHHVRSYESHHLIERKVPRHHTDEYSDRRILDVSNRPFDIELMVREEFFGPICIELDNFGTKCDLFAALYDALPHL